MRGVVAAFAGPHRVDSRALRWTYRRPICAKGFASVQRTLFAPIAAASFLLTACTVSQQSAGVGAAAGCAAGAVIEGRDGCFVGAAIGGVSGYYVGRLLERDLRAKANAYDSLRSQEAQLRASIVENQRLIAAMSAYLAERRQELAELRRRVERGQASRTHLHHTARKSIQAAVNLERKADAAIRDYHQYMYSLSHDRRRQLSPLTRRLEEQLAHLKTETNRYQREYRALAGG